MTETVMTNPSTPTGAARWSTLMVAVGAFFYAALILFTRNINGLDALTIAFYRAGFAFLFFLALTPWFRQALNWRSYRPAIPWMVTLGLLQAVTATLYIFAIQNISAANAALLCNTAPVYIAFLAPWLLRESRPRFAWISLPLVIAGVVLISGVFGEDFSSISWIGFGSGVASGFTFALMVLVSRRAGFRAEGAADGFTQAMWSAGVCALALIPAALVSDWNAGIQQLPLLFAMGSVTLGLAPLLYYTALQHLPSQVMSTVAILEPVFGALIGVLFFAEIITLPGLVGSAMVLGAIYLITR